MREHDRAEYQPGEQERDAAGWAGRVRFTDDLPSAERSR